MSYSANDAGHRRKRARCRRPSAHCWWLIRISSAGTLSGIQSPVIWSSYPGCRWLWCHRHCEQATCSVACSHSWYRTASHTTCRSRPGHSSLRKKDKFKLTTKTAQIAPGRAATSSSSSSSRRKRVCMKARKRKQVVCRKKRAGQVRSGLLLGRSLGVGLSRTMRAKRKQTIES